MFHRVHGLGVKGCEVKGCNSMTVRGRRTQPLLMMALQITHKQERGTGILSLLVNNQKSGHLGQGCDEDVDIKVVSHTTNLKKNTIS